MNTFSLEYGFPHEWGKDDYSPESLFYRLGMKDSNSVADLIRGGHSTSVIFQKILDFGSIRKHLVL